MNTLHVAHSNASYLTTTGSVSSSRCSSALSYYLSDTSSTTSSSVSKPSRTAAAKLYIKYIRRAWKRVSKATRKPERASVLPEGFIIISNANANFNSKRKSILFA
ncbi:hypothetical protein PNOK_0372800 [Pyrrhoderma noxium]|uniref:Uncharacterized protein n=1 Tax=Pyrrhoderma noxium TaxID=2282107 RepID=A0A286UNB8_9AGAM|nr:hypothetical protein PNOK_0372800 [Pyrrhoderma noxium]